MHLKLCVFANVCERVHLIVFVPLGFLQLDHYLILLACVVNHFTHHLLFPLNQLLAGVNVRFNELISEQIKATARGRQDMTVL